MWKTKQKIKTLRWNLITRRIWARHQPNWSYWPSEKTTERSCAARQAIRLSKAPWSKQPRSRSSVSVAVATHSVTHSPVFVFVVCCCFCYYCLAPFLSLLDVAGIVSSSYRIVCLLYVFVWMCLCLWTCTYVWALLLSAVWRAKFNQALYTRDQVNELREQEPDVMRALLDKPSPLLSSSSSSLVYPFLYILNSIATSSDSLSTFQTRRTNPR